jgi:hypothetical protein
MHFLNQEGLPMKIKNVINAVNNKDKEMICFKAE